MPSRSWSTGLAVGLIAGVGLALLFLVWAVPEFRGPVDHPGAYSAEKGEGGTAAEDEQSNEPQWRYWTRRLVSAEDTLAQWVMAFFAVAATGITAVGVYFIWQTLEQTREAVRETAAGTAAAMAAAKAAHDANQIAARQFEAGFKPWLVVKITGPYVRFDKGTGGGPLPKSPIRSFNKGEEPRPVPIDVLFTVTNVSEMPATIVASRVYIHGHHPAEDTRTFDVLTKGDNFFPGVAGGRVPKNIETPQPHECASIGILILRPENREHLMQNPPPVVGEIDYLDPLGKRRRFGFAFAPTVLWGSDFHRWGGENYNYDREIKQQS